MTERELVEAMERVYSRLSKIGDGASALVCIECLLQELNLKETDETVWGTLHRMKVSKK